MGTEGTETPMIEKHFWNYDDAVFWMTFQLDKMTDIEPEGDFDITFRYVNRGWQVSLWDCTDSE